MNRFAFDLGSGSLGWAVFRLDIATRSPTDLVDMGVRIFPTGRDPKSNESNASGRRQPRQQRRQFDRRKKRRNELEMLLCANGLMPPRAASGARKSFFEIDPYEAREAAVSGAVGLPTLGRAIWHISKHRGFKSNRKTDRSNESETGAIATAATELQRKLVDAGAPTYGAWLNIRHANREPVRIRPSGTGTAIAYDYYPVRAVLEAEFDRIWQVQAAHNKALNSSIRDEIRDAVFYQRPLKPVLPGRCTFFSDEFRLPKWHPLAQEFIILQQLNMIRILGERGERPLELGVRNLILKQLVAGQSMTWAALRKALKLTRDTKINLEEGGLKTLAHDIVAARFSGTSKKPGLLAGRWEKMTSDERIKLLNIIDRAQSDEQAVTGLRSELGLSAELSSRVAEVSLPDGHLMIGERAVRAIVEVMRSDVVIYSDAVRIASERGLFGAGAVVHHSDLRPDGDPGLDKLPRYFELPTLQRMIGTGTGNPDDPPEVRFGRVSNPTVHVALGQFRRVMNALIDLYGKPAEVVIETARDMAKSARELNDIAATIRKNTTLNDQRREELEANGVLARGGRAGDRLLRMRLWEELGASPADRLCPYTGKPIALHQLHSDAVEIDHILPFEDTFDDGPANKTVCFRAANRIKAKRPPAAAWSGTELEEIIARVSNAKGMKHKLWRFLPGAMEKWESDRGFEDRQLHATGYLAKVIRAYAETLFPKDGTSNIWMPPGMMTAMLRKRWRIFLPDHSAKSRNDHRHHALDAAVVGVIDRWMVQILQTHARRIGAAGLDRVMPDPPPPFEGYQDQVRNAVAKVTTSHRPNHSISGRLQEDTAYGEVRDVPENLAARTIGNMVVRKPVAALSAKEIGQIRDEKIRGDLLTTVAGKTSDKRTLTEALGNWSRASGHRRLRILKPAANARALAGPDGRPEKFLVPGENAYLDILESPDGNWFCQPTDIWAAQDQSPDAWKDEYPDARFIMRLFKGDTVQLFDLNTKGLPVTGSNGVKKVVRLEPSANRIRLVGVNDSGIYNDRHNDADDPFRWDLATISKLKTRRARRVRVDDLGRVRTIPNGTI